VRVTQVLESDRTRTAGDPKLHPAGGTGALLGVRELPTPFARCAWIRRRARDLAAAAGVLVVARRTRPRPLRAQVINKVQRVVGGKTLPSPRGNTRWLGEARIAASRYGTSSGTIRTSRVPCPSAAALTRTGAATSGERQDRRLPSRGPSPRRACAGVEADGGRPAPWSAETGLRECGEDRKNLLAREDLAAALHDDCTLTIAPGSRRSRDDAWDRERTRKSGRHLRGVVVRPCRDLFCSTSAAAAPVGVGESARGRGVEYERAQFVEVLSERARKACFESDRRCRPSCFHQESFRSP